MIILHSFHNCAWPGRLHVAVRALGAPIHSERASITLSPRPSSLAESLASDLQG